MARTKATSLYGTRKKPSYGMFICFWPFKLQLNGFSSWGYDVVRKRQNEWGDIEYSKDGGRVGAVVLHFGRIHLMLGSYSGYGYCVFRAYTYEDGEEPLGEDMTYEQHMTECHGGR